MRWRWERKAKERRERKAKKEEDDEGVTPSVLMANSIFSNRQSDRQKITDDLESPSNPRLLTDVWIPTTIPLRPTISFPAILPMMSGFPP